MKELQKYIVLLLLLFLGGLLFFNQQRSAQIRALAEESIAQGRRQLSSSMSAFDMLSRNFYNDSNDFISRVLYEAQEDNTSDQALWRNELLNRFYPVYRSAVLFGLDQFQVHDRTGHSFLRFHYPEFFGDDLRPVRPSIDRLVKEKRFLKGFEVGRFVDGLRYIYPLFYDGDFVGSYEWVWKHEAIVRELHRIYGGTYLLLVERPMLQRITRSEVVTRQYAALPSCSDYLYQKNALSLYDARRKALIERVTREQRFCRLLEAGRDYAALQKIDGADYMLSAVRLRSITTEPYGYFVSIEPTKRMIAIDRLFLAEIIFLVIVLVLIFLLLRRSYLDKIFVRALLDSQKDLVILSDGVRLKDANLAFLRFFEVKSVKEFVDRFGCICNLFIPADGYFSKEENSKNWLKDILEKNKQSRVIIFDRHRGEERVFMVSLNPFDHTGLYVISFRDITELERENRHFKIESMMDHLTGLYNKRSFERYLKEKLDELRQLERDDVAMIMFDIDHFKRINDLYGHQKGDEVLKRLSALVASMLRKSDFVVRWGGEEFVIIMDHSPLEAACLKAEELRHRISLANFGLKEALTCSFGVTMLRADDTPESAVERVDRILYRAKESGRNRVVCEEEASPQQAPQK